MLEIIALIFITKDVGKLAQAKGVKPLNWKIYTIIAWVVSEIAGIFIGALIFGTGNLFSVVMIGLTFAITSYFIIKATLNKLPDYFDNDIDNIGNN